MWVRAWLQAQHGEEPVTADNSPAVLVRAFGWHPRVRQLVLQAPPQLLLATVKTAGAGVGAGVGAGAAVRSWAVDMAAVCRAAAAATAGGAGAISAELVDRDEDGQEVGLGIYPALVLRKGPV